MTAYTNAPVFSHGDFPIAANMNKISTGQVHIYEVAPTYAIQPCIKKLGTDDQLCITHRFRWLHYKSTGAISDPAGSEDDVSLPNPSDNWVNVYDLDSVPWLSYGAIYYVTGVDFACEDKEG